MDDKGPSPIAIKSLTRVGALRDQQIRLDLEVTQEVARARMHGASWRMISVALGTSTQAAWERYRPPDRPRPIPGQRDPYLPRDGDGSLSWIPDASVTSDDVRAAQQLLDTPPDP